MNWIAVLVAAFVPLVVGFVWYSPALFGKAWQKSLGLTDEQIKSSNMILIFGLTFVFSFFIAFVTQFLVVHQFSVYGLLDGQPESMWSEHAKGFITETANNFRTFKHGALHGALSALFLVFPIIAINGMFSRKSWKLILIDSGYWLVSIALMGGVVSVWQ